MKIHEMYPYLIVKDAAKAIGFYTKAFGATEKFRLADPGDGKIGHAELDFDGKTLMLADEFPEHGITASKSSIHLHVENADVLIQQALAAGAELERPAQDQFYGERSGTVRDPFGNRWHLGHHLEELSPEEMQRRWDAMSKSG